MTTADAVAVRHGRAIELSQVWAPYRDVSGSTEGWAEHVGAHALFSPEGEFLALVNPADDGSTKYLAVFSRP